MMNDSFDINALLDSMVIDIRAYCRTRGYDDVVMIGIKRGGAWVAKLLHTALELNDPLGELNIAFYRDDFSAVGLHPEVNPSCLPTDINNRHVLLVDDVLYTGRTVRAAMNEVFDYGRPASISLAVLIDRCQRELPIQANIIGKTMTLGAGEHVKLLGPEPLAFSFTGDGNKTD